MSLLTIFTSSEQKSFDSPPKTSSKELVSMFMLSDEINNIIFNMRSDVNKIGFMLQLGYFKATGKFFATDQFRNQDIVYLSKLLNIDSDEIDIEHYTTKSRMSHKKAILALQGWTDFGNTEKIDLINAIDR